MKKNVFALGAFLIGSLILTSCNGGGAAPQTSLKNTVDSLSYAYGVNLADQGLVQYLEQMGILQSVSGVEYEYQMKLATADSTQKVVIEKEYKSKLDSINKINAPKLNEFIKGVQEAFKNDNKSAYAQGILIGKQISKDMLPQFSSTLFANDSTKKLNENQVLAGLIGMLKNSKLAIEKENASTLIQNAAEASQKEAQLKQEEELKAQYKDSIAAGEQFLAENAKRAGVVTLPSGLQYEIIREGNGATPVDGDQVKVHYHGTLINGTVFDSSIERKEPIVFGVNNVIPGWTEALKLMPVGSKWKLYIPYNLAYGAQDKGTIKPFSTLIFDVELLSIEK